MPASKNPDSYAHICFEMLDAFASGKYTQLILDGQDYRTTEGPWPTEKARKKAKQLQLTFNSFRQAMRSSGHPQYYILAGLEFSFQETHTGGTCTIIKRDINGFTNAVRAAMNREDQKGPNYTPKPMLDNSSHLGDPTKPNAFVGSPTEPQQKPWDYKPPAVEPTIRSPAELEAEVLRDGVASTKKFEAVMLQLGFTTDADALKPPPKDTNEDPSNDT